MLKSYLAFTSAVHHVLTRAYERLGAAIARKPLLTILLSVAAISLANLGLLKLRSVGDAIHAFLLQPCDDAAARVAAALRKVGAPIVSGALTTVLGIGFLEFGNSVTYFVFFKMFFITIVFGLLHGMLLLPVLLAWFGPPPSADAHAHAAESVLGHGAPERKDLLGGDDDE